MIKKILGIILIILSILIFLGTLAGLPTTISLLSVFNGYSFGYLIGQIIFLVLGYFLFKTGSKWTKGPIRNNLEIDKIGKE